MHRVGARVLFVLVLLAATLAVAPARAQTGGDVVDACVGALGAEPPQGGPCRTLRHLLSNLARLCRLAGGGELCTVLDGRSVAESLVAAQEASWTSRALALQRGLDDDYPLEEGVWAHTHNSFNAEAYDPTLSNSDANQIYSVRDQLRMGIRAIELDIHWVPHPQGDPNAVVTCHGEPVPAGPVVIHVGCTNDRLFRDALAEIRGWMDDNPSEVILLYLENALDGDPAAHRAASRQLEAALGPLIDRPPSDDCTPLPIDRSRREIRDAGKRVILTGNCGPGGWNARVFDRGPRWHEGGLGWGDDFPAYPCTARRDAENYATDWIRHWEDSTGLSYATGGGGDVTVADMRNMVRCGVNMLGLDQLVPGDPRLDAMVWSWAPDEPAAPGGCAAQGADGRFRAEDCAQTHRVACLADGAWVVGAPSAWPDAAASCAAAGGAFAVPWNGFENARLRDAAGDAVVWLAYSGAGGIWTPA